MKKFRKRVDIEAEQWFPGNGCEGVLNDHTTKLCGCVMIGGPSEPHTHETGISIYLIQPGDYVIRTDTGYKVMACNEFQATYKEI